MTSEIVTLKDGKPVTTSFIVAESFGKEHRNVIRDVERILNSETYQKRGVLNFEQTPYIHPQNGQTYRMSTMDRQGFEILAMGFTGEKALEWKLKYSDAFAMMESALTQQMPIGFALPKTKAEALFLAAEQARIIEEQEARLSEQEPKVLLYDQLAGSDGLIRLSNLLGMLKGKTGQDYKMADLKLFLRKAGMVCWQKEFEPTVKAIDSGWFAVRYEERRYDNEIHMVPEWAITPKERMEARRPRWLERMRNDPNRQASRRCDSAWSRAPSGIDLLSAPVFRLGSRGVLHHQPFQIGGDAAVLCGGLLDQQCFEFRRHLEIDIDGFPHVFHQIILANRINVLYHTLHDYPTQGD